MCWAWNRRHAVSSPAPNEGSDGLRAAVRRPRRYASAGVAYHVCHRSISVRAQVGGQHRRQFRQFRRGSYACAREDSPCGVGARAGNAGMEGCGQSSLLAAVHRPLRMSFSSIGCRPTVGGQHGGTGSSRPGRVAGGGGGVPHAGRRERPRGHTVGTSAPRDTKRARTGTDSAAPLTCNDGPARSGPI